MSIYLLHLLACWASTAFLPSTTPENLELEKWINKTTLPKTMNIHEHNLNNCINYNPLFHVLNVDNSNSTVTMQIEKDARKI